MIILYTFFNLDVSVVWWNLKHLGESLFVKWFTTLIFPTFENKYKLLSGEMFLKIVLKKSLRELFIKLFYDFL